MFTLIVLVRQKHRDSIVIVICITEAPSAVNSYDNSTNRHISVSYGLENSQ